jgi:hypothetical protein
VVFSANGKSLYCSFPGSGGGLDEIPIQGGASRPVLRGLTDGAVINPIEELPQGGGPRAVLYTVRRGGSNHIGVANLETGRSVELIQAGSATYSRSGYLLYRNDEGIFAAPFSRGELAITGVSMPVAQVQAGFGVSVSDDGTLIYDDASGVGPEQLTWRDRAGNKVGTLGEPQISPAYPDFSPDGTRVALSAREQGNTDVWIYDVKSGSRSRFTFDPAIDWMPAWSPSGREIAFVSSRTGNGDIYVQPADGTGQAKAVVVSKLPQYLRGWSRSGVLTFNRDDPKTRFDLWTFRANPDGGFTDPVPFLQTEFMDYLGTVSPDGRFMLYASTESGNEVYVKPFPDTGGKWQISNHGGFWPRWRRDGKEIFYFEGESLMAVPVSTDGAFKSGAPQRLFPFWGQAGAIYRKYEASPDGTRFLVAETVNTNGASRRRIRIVENWLAAADRTRD